MTKDRNPVAKDAKNTGKDQKVAAPAASKQVEVKGKVEAKKGDVKDQKPQQKVDAKGNKGENKEHKGKDQKPKEVKDQKPPKAEGVEDAVVPKVAAAVQPVAAPAPQANTTGKMRNVVYQDYMTPNTNKVGANAKGNKIRKEKNKFTASYGERSEDSTPRPQVEKNSGAQAKDKKGKAGVKA